MLAFTPVITFSPYNGNINYHYATLSTLLKGSYRVSHIIAKLEELAVSCSEKLNYLGRRMDSECEAYRACAAAYGNLKTTIAHWISQLNDSLGVPDYSIHDITPWVDTIKKTEPTIILRLSTGAKAAALAASNSADVKVETKIAAADPKAKDSSTISKMEAIEFDPIETTDNPALSKDLTIACKAPKALDAKTVTREALSTGTTPDKSLTRPTSPIAAPALVMGTHKISSKEKPSAFSKYEAAKHKEFDF